MIRRLSSSNVIRPDKWPRLATFDLDHTVWPFGIDSYRFIPPYHFHGSKLIDMNQQPIEHFPDFPKIFELLKSNGVKIAIASRTKFPTGARRLIEMFDWHRYIDYYQIYPGQKMKHFERIRQESSIDFNEMIFFDDEERNIVDVGQLGVHAVLVPSETGATESIVIDSIKKYSTAAANQKS